MDVLDVAFMVAEALEHCGVGWFLGGSLASSFQGEPRATNDIDLVVDLAEAQVAPLAAALGPDFDVDETALREAVRRHGTWNLIHLPTVTKIDLFILRDEPFDRSEFERRRPVEIRPGHQLVLKSAEDTVLRKLLGWRAGGGVSDRQWRDLVEVLRQSGARLDQGYLDGWAGRLGLVAELARARGEARGERA